jgi:hypothetical protein
MACKDSILTVVGVLEGKATSAIERAQASEHADERDALIKEALVYLDAAKLVREMTKNSDPAPRITRTEEKHFHYHRPYGYPYSWHWSPMYQSYTIGGGNTTSTLTPTYSENSANYDNLRSLVESTGNAIKPFA